MAPFTVKCIVLPASAVRPPLRSRVAVVVTCVVDGVPFPAPSVPPLFTVTAPSATPSPRSTPVLSTTMAPARLPVPLSCSSPLPLTVVVPLKADIADADEVIKKPPEPPVPVMFRWLAAVPVKVPRNVLSLVPVTVSVFAPISKVPLLSWKTLPMVSVALWRTTAAAPVVNNPAVSAIAFPLVLLRFSVMPVKNPPPVTDTPPVLVLVPVRVTEVPFDSELNAKLPVPDILPEKVTAVLLAINASCASVKITALSILVLPVTINPPLSISNAPVPKFASLLILSDPEVL